MATWQVTSCSSEWKYCEKVYSLLIVNLLLNIQQNVERPTLLHQYQMLQKVWCVLWPVNFSTMPLSLFQSKLPVVWLHFSLQVSV